MAKKIYANWKFYLYFAQRKKAKEEEQEHNPTS